MGGSSSPSLFMSSSKEQPPSGQSRLHWNWKRAATKGTSSAPKPGVQLAAPRPAKVPAAHSKHWSWSELALEKRPRSHSSHGPALPGASAMRPAAQSTHGVAPETAAPSESWSCLPTAHCSQVAPQ